MIHLLLIILRSKMVRSAAQKPPTPLILLPDFETCAIHAGRPEKVNCALQ
jgi:hypothetical protein